MCVWRKERAWGGGRLFFSVPQLGPTPRTLWGLEIHEGWVGCGQGPLSVCTAVCSPGSLFFLCSFRTCPQNFKSPQLWFSLHHFYLVLASCVFT